MDYRVGGKTLNNREQEGIITDVADVHVDGIAAEGLPERGALLKIGHRIQGLPVQFHTGPAPEIVIHHGYVKSPGGEAHGRGPAQVPITT
jgi:hypothetical protein